MAGFNREIISKSVEGRNVHLLIISSNHENDKYDKPKIQLNVNTIKNDTSFALLNK